MLVDQYSKYTRFLFVRELSSVSKLSGFCKENKAKILDIILV
jgi:hypothetical protein